MRDSMFKASFDISHRVPAPANAPGSTLYPGEFGRKVPTDQKRAFRWEDKKNRRHITGKTLDEVVREARRVAEKKYKSHRPNIHAVKLSGYVVAGTATCHIDVLHEED